MSNAMGIPEGDKKVKVVRYKFEEIFFKLDENYKYTYPRSKTNPNTSNINKTISRHIII